ncbi:MAG: flagellar basal body-associated protein FliL [Paracoccaceae bacterium]|jgi:hypothetical protein|nr:flagellar basal body-associated protein FliL [Paracoccaceae bacterium]MDP7186291.1 flagellar basal body-associated protein FliL [Paracoccaceae bacterium]
MKKILPVLLVLLGLAAGIGGGLYVSAQTADAEKDEVECAPPDEEKAKAKPAPPANTEFVKLNNQFVVPVVADGLVKSLVVLSLSVEATEGQAARVFEVEPRLRDSFLQVLFDFANLGGFDGAFTNSNNLIALKTQLYEAAYGIIGEDARSVLIVDIVRQDI